MSSVERGRWKFVSNAPVPRKRVAGPDEQVGAAGAGEDPAAAGRERVLERTARGRADAHDAPPGTEGAVQGRRGRRRDLVVLGVEAVLARVVGLHRLERPRADVQREAGGLDAAVGERGEQLGGEVQARRGRRHGAARPRVDGLVALAIGRARARPRAGCTAAAAPRPPPRVPPRRAAVKTPPARCRPRDARGGSRAPTASASAAPARRRFAGRAITSQSDSAERAHEQQLGLTPAGPARAQPRRDHPHVVEQEQVARPQAAPAATTPGRATPPGSPAATRADGSCPAAWRCCAISRSGRSYSKSAVRTRKCYTLARPPASLAGFRGGSGGRSRGAVGAAPRARP